MKRILPVWTAQMARWRKADDLDMRFLDTTYMTGVKAGNEAFAPKEEWVKAYKSGEMPMGEYVHLYECKLWESIEINAAKWQDLINTMAPLVVACYCPAGQFCHRHPFVDLLTVWAHRQGVTVVNMGEFTDENFQLYLDRPKKISTGMIKNLSFDDQIELLLLEIYSRKWSDYSAMDDDTLDELREYVKERDEMGIKHSHPLVNVRQIATLRNLDKLPTPDSILRETYLDAGLDDYRHGIENGSLMDFLMSTLSPKRIAYDVTQNKEGHENH